jgi:hypothetical protein
MKKLLVILTALAVVFGVTAAAHAAGVQNTLTSPTIVKTGCERAGSVTFSFAEGNVINPGDWWYMDLPSTVTICKPLDYVITGGGVNSASGGVVDIANATAPTYVNAALLAGGALGIPTIAEGGAAVGPLSVVDTGGAAGNMLAAGGNIVLRVTAAVNARRVFIQAYGDNVGATLTVQSGCAFVIKMLDGALHNDFLVLDDEKDLLYGDATTALNDDLLGPVPSVQNTLCINAESYTGDLVFVSFDSLNSEFTFSGDSQIAHVGAAAQIALAHCKGDITGNIEIGAQNECEFSYEGTNATNNYCTGFDGNYFIIDSSTTFGEVGDLWTLTVTSDTAGVYFSSNSIVVNGFIPTDTDQCDSTQGAAVTAGFTGYTSTGAATAFPTNSCSVASGARVVKLALVTGTTIASIHTFDRLRVDLPSFMYDSSIVANGTEVDVTLTLGKYPCGDIWNGTRTIGTFVTDCPASGSATQTTLMYPFLPALDGSMPGWWGGFTVNNAGTGAGTAVLTFWESDGDTATYTTASIAAGRMWTMAAEDLLAAVTPGAANAGTFGDSNVMVTVVCNFARGGGFAFTGNGEEGTGYTAYVLSGSVWQ